MPRLWNMSFYTSCFSSSTSIGLFRHFSPVSSDNLSMSFSTNLTFFYPAQKVLSKCPLTNLNKWRRLVVSAIQRIIAAADTRVKPNEAVPADSFWFFIMALLAPVEPRFQAAKSHFGTSHVGSPFEIQRYQNDQKTPPHFVFDPSHWPLSRLDWHFHGGARQRPSIVCQRRVVLFSHQHFFFPSPT